VTRFTFVKLLVLLVPWRGPDAPVLREDTLCPPSLGVPEREPP